jgi:small GTP-binding protein
MPATASEEIVKLKVCLIGEKAVGKTSLIRRFVDDAFDDRYLATLGTKVTKRVLTVTMPGSGKQGHVDMTIWDIMGDAKFRQLLKLAYFRGAQGILAVCDVTRPATLGKLDDWRSSVEKIAGEVPAYVLANKVDLEPGLSARDLKAFGTDWRAPTLFTSAKTGENVKAAFAGLALMILESQLQRQAAHT